MTLDTEPRLSYIPDMLDTDKYVASLTSLVTNGISAGAIVSSILGILPPVLSCIAAVFGICWSGICIWESKTVQGWRHRRNRKAEL